MDFAEVVNRAFGDTVDVDLEASFFAATAERFDVSFGGLTFFAYDNGEGFDDDGSAPPFPAGSLTLEIPGAAGGYPGMTVAIPSVRAMVLTAPALTGAFSAAILVDATTAFEWEPRAAAEPASYVTFFAAPAFPMVGGEVVECYVPDTGTFAFSAETQVELGAKFSGTLWDFARVVRHVHVDASSGGTIVLTVERGASSLGGLGF